MKTAMTTGLREYFELGAKLANQQELSERLTQKYPESASRSLGLVIVRPRQDVARYIGDWLDLFIKDKLKEGAVSAESFFLCFDPQSKVIQVTDSGQVKQPTVLIYIDEDTAWSLASRSESIYSSYMKSHHVRVVGKYMLRDIEVIDEMLEQFYQMMGAAGHDLAALFGGNDGR